VQKFGIVKRRGQTGSASPIGCVDTPPAHTSPKDVLTQVSPKSLRVLHPDRRQPVALIRFTEYLFTYKILQLSNNKKAGFLLPFQEAWKPAPLQSRTETLFKISGARTFPRSR
jgi:hypothetical protein